MRTRGHCFLIAGSIALSLGCQKPAPEQEPVPTPVAQTAAQPVPDADRAREIDARNREILERLEREELERKRRAARTLEQTIETAAAPEAVRVEEPNTSGMQELQARADELEPRVAAIASVASRVDDNYRRYRDACHEKYTSAVTSPHDATLYYEPYQPLVVDNETTPYCRELWSDIERDAADVELAMKSLIDDARRIGVLPGHLRVLAHKYQLDRDGWRQ